MSGGTKGRKRNAPCDKSYKIEGRYFKNRSKRIAKHLKAHPNDDQTREALNG